MALIAFAFAADVREPAQQQDFQGLVVLGVTGPKNIVLTAQHPTAIKPVTVVIANQSAEPKVFTDAASLQNLVELTVTPAGGTSRPLLTLVPPKKMPVVLQPDGKLSLVFNARFDRGDSTGGTIGIRYAVAMNPTSLDPTLASATIPTLAASPRVNALAVPAANGKTSNQSIPQAGPDNGATVTASTTVVALKSGQTASSPITFNVKWPGHSFFVSEWASNPADTTANSTLSNSHSTSVTARWGAPGKYEVKVYLVAQGGGAEPSVEINVVQVTMPNDLNGANIGVSTKTPRKQTFTATVNPPSQAGSVTIKASKGADKLNVETTNTDTGTGMITFDVEGTGTTGSAKKNDCTIEATVGGKPAGSADLSVVVPKFIEGQVIVSRNDHNFLAYESDGRHAGSSPHITGAPVWPMAQRATFYGFDVEISVSDQFHQDIDGAHLYLGADVGERFAAGTFSINQKIRSGSVYRDPAGFPGQDWNPARAPVKEGSSAANAFLSAPPLFPSSKFAHAPSLGSLEVEGEPFTVVVDGFALQPQIHRTFKISKPDKITLIQTP